MRFASLAQLLEGSATPIYVVLFGGSVLVGLVSLLLLLCGRRDLVLSFCVFLNAVLAASFIACLLGDGYADLARHFHIGQNALLILPVVSVFVVGRLLRDWLAVPPRRSANQTSNIPD